MLGIKLILTAQEAIQRQSICTLSRAT